MKRKNNYYNLSSNYIAFLFIQPPITTLYIYFAHYSRILFKQNLEIPKIKVKIIIQIKSKTDLSFYKFHLSNDKKEKKKRRKEYPTVTSFPSHRKRGEEGESGSKLWEPDTREEKRRIRRVATGGVVLGKL